MSGSETVKVEVKNNMSSDDDGLHADVSLPPVVSGVDTWSPEYWEKNIPTPF